MAGCGRIIRMPAGSVTLEGELVIPGGARGVVVFAHGSGSSRHSPRNQAVATVLQVSGLATLLVDLLTSEEEAIDTRTSHLRFDIPLLARRLMAIDAWLTDQPATSTLRLGYFGASTGAGAALIAAAEQPERIGAVVSRGGRPDLAGQYLPAVKAPTLLVVGGRDEVVIELNEQAQRQLQAPRHLEIVPGATHLFEEPGALERVAALARDWFLRYLVPTGQPA